MVPGVTSLSKQVFCFFFSFVFSLKKKSRFEIFIKALAETDHLWVKNS